MRPLTLASRPRSIASLVLAVLATALLGSAPLRAAPAPDTPSASASDGDAALPAQLSLAEALRRFRASGLDLLIADAAVAGAQAEALAAGAVANPSLTVGVGSAIGYQSDPVACPQCSPLAVNLGLSDNGLLGDLVSGRRGLRRRVADAALVAARLGRADAERTLVSQVKQAYAQTALAQRLVAFADEVQSAANKTLELNQVRYRTGAISEAALARVEVDKLTADQARDGATQSLRLAQVGLAYLLGARRAVPVFTVGDEFSGAGASSVVPERQALIDRALQTRPDLLAAGAQLDRAAASLTLARRLNVPDLSLGIAYQMQGVGSLAIQPPTLAVALTITPPLFNQHRGERERARAEGRLAQAQRDKLVAQVVTDVESAHAALVASQRRAQRSEGQLLGRAKRARDLIAFQYEKGAASLLEYIDAQRTYIANSIDYFNNLGGYWTARFQLEQAVGAELAP